MMHFVETAPDRGAVSIEPSRQDVLRVTSGPGLPKIAASRGVRLSGFFCWFGLVWAAGGDDDVQGWSHAS